MTETLKRLSSIWNRVDHLDPVSLKSHGLAPVNGSNHPIKNGATNQISKNFGNSQYSPRGVRLAYVHLELYTPALLFADLYCHLKFLRASIARIDPF